MRSAQLRSVALGLVIGGLSVIAGIYVWQVVQLPWDNANLLPPWLVTSFFLLTLAEIALAVGFGFFLWTYGQRDPANGLARLGVALLGLGQFAIFASYLKFVLDTQRRHVGWPPVQLWAMIAAELIVTIGFFCFASVTGPTASIRMQPSLARHVPDDLNPARWILAAGFAIAAIDAMHTQDNLRQGLISGGLAIAVPIISAGAWWLLSTGVRKEPQASAFPPIGALVIGISWWCVVAANITGQIARRQMNPEASWTSTWYVVKFAAQVVIAIGFFVLAHELFSASKGTVGSGETISPATGDIEDTGSI